MKRRKISIAAVTLASGLLFSISHIQGAHADDQHERGCSNKSLKGSYGSYRTGNGSMGPAAGVGRLTFDGNGNLWFPMFHTNMLGEMVSVKVIDLVSFTAILELP